MEQNKKISSDLQDSKRDKQYLKKEETTIDIPDVKDIPGQEHIHVPKMKEMIDTTISSDDEEGKGLFEEDELDAETNVSAEEKELLQSSSESMAGEDDEARKNIVLDNTDEDGELLNVQNDISGDDLDVPGAELDDADEATGNEDEENNTYSWGQ
ncbi:hypothetical protein FRZ67_21650 [Panacibacter ginsenosidivorans]|uniref:Uncharacterized protein n=1 Tax=Panacibacter ginsenosidivorans TaxID=1813871 RepID=A0A5B8VGT2_9BACT|nr:hypothetical protein [Panacibacter ginsenosidivorans]QEC69776.1 hypothetical protein FRZ67_21650 [Panacibacter ginsenosidivorans]